MKNKYRYPSDFQETDHPFEVAAQEILGANGKLVAASKGRYSRSNPTHLVVYNANVVTANQKIWHGDLDLTLETTELLALSKKINEPIYILQEMDARFDKDFTFDLKEAIMYVSEEKVNLRDSEWWYQDSDQIPHLLTKEEYDQKHPEEVERRKKEKLEATRQLKEEDYVPMTIPAIKEFNSTSKKESPVEKLQKYFLNKFDNNREEASECFLNIWFSESWHKEFDEMLAQYCKKVLKIKDEYEIEKAVAWSTFDMPMNFIGDPEWAEENTGYIKKERVSAELLKRFSN